MIIYKIEENVERNCIFFGHRLVVPTFLQEHFLNDCAALSKDIKSERGKKVSKKKLEVKKSKIFIKKFYY